MYVQSRIFRLRTKSGSDFKCRNYIFKLEKYKRQYCMYKPEYKNEESRIMYKRNKIYERTLRKTNEIKLIVIN